MKRRVGLIVAILALAASIPPALGSASFSCHAVDKNVAGLVFEGATPRDGSSLANFGGVIEIEPGQKIEFDRANVTRFAWRRNLRIAVRKKLAGRAFVEIQIRTHMKGEEMPFPGSYMVRTEKTRRSGRLSCEGD